jgi:hypothetical protein
LSLTNLTHPSLLLKIADKHARNIILILTQEVKQDIVCHRTVEGAEKTRSSQDQDIGASTLFHQETGVPP